MPPQANAHTKCRNAAVERRNRSVTAAARSRITVALTKASARSAIMSAALLPRVRNELAQASQLGIGKPCRRKIEERGDCLLRRAVEECVEQLPQRRLARALARHRGEKHVARTVFLVPEMTLVLQHPQQRADGGVTGWIGKLVEQCPC